MTMNSYLAEMYGTNGAGDAAPSEGALKEAQLQLFAKLAAQNGVDLNAMTPDQINSLYTEVMKTASDEPPPFPPKKEEGDKKDGEKDDKADEKKKEEEKKEAALRQRALSEFQEKQAHEAKLAEAELIGQVMAHSFVRELNAIEKDASAKQAAATPARPLPSQQKQASAFDTFAAKNAVKLASEATFDGAEVERRLEALFTLGKVAESTKTAGVADPATAIHVRSLELLEAIGVPVDWNAK